MGQFTTTKAWYYLFSISTCKLLCIWCCKILLEEMQKDWGLKTIIFLGRCGVVVFGSWNLSEIQGVCRIDQNLQNSSWPCRSPVSHFPSWFPTLTFARGSHFRQSFQNMGKCQWPVWTQLSYKLSISVPVRKPYFFDWCIFSSTTPLENYHSAAEPTGHEQPELCLPGQLPAGCLELCRKVLPSIQQHSHPTMLTVSGCPVGTPRNCI